MEATAAGVVLAEDEATAVPWDDADLARLGGGDAAAAAGECGAGDFFRMLLSPPPPRLRPLAAVASAAAAAPIPELSLPLRIMPRLGCCGGCADPAVELCLAHCSTAANRRPPCCCWPPAAPSPLPRFSI